MSKSNKGSRYTVGYGKPPAQYRFKKGQSGNPKGRPKKPKEEPEPLRFRDGRLGSLLEHEAFRPLNLHENGKPIELPAVQAIMRSVLVEGVKGNRLAKKYAFEMLLQEQEGAVSRSIDHYEYLAANKAEGEAKIARYQAQGLLPPRLFPHPDDILLDEARLQAHLLGPLSADEAIPYDRGALARDWFLARSVFQEKYGEVATLECKGTSAPAAEVFAEMIQLRLPPSFRRNQAATVVLLMDLHSLTKRQLRQRIADLMAQIAHMPDRIEEQLTARERLSDVLGVIAEGFERAAAGTAAR